MVCDRLLLFSSDGIIVEISALLLVLILTDIKGVSADGVDPTGIVVLKLLRWCGYSVLRLVYVIHVVVDVTGVAALLSKHRRLKGLVTQVSVRLFLVDVSVVHIYILRVLHSGFAFYSGCLHAAYYRLRI